MKTINDLKDELSVQFGSIMSGIGAGELDLIITFILTSFAYDFPEVSSRAYKFDTTASQLKVYLNEIHDEFLETQYTIPIQKLSSISKEFYNQIYAIESQFTQLDEYYAIQLTNQYIQCMSSYYVPKKPLILSDSTGDFVTFNRDTVMMYTNERIVDPSNIKEYVYDVLRVYSYYKFTDFIVNRQFSNLLDINQKVFDLVYGSISSDLSTGDMEQVTSVALSGLSVSFASKITSYSTALGQLANSFNNPVFVQEMNKMREVYANKFKRKKNVFYNYIF